MVPPPTVADPAPSQDRLADWLALHGVDARLCETLLTGPLPPLALPMPGPAAQDSAPELPGPDQVWPQLCDFFIHAFPAGEELIRQTFARAHCDFRSGVRASDRALSLLHPEQGIPVVICPWQGRPRDLLSLAHEAAHAVQLLASEGRFMPPILRETCAMLGEYAALRGLAQSDPATGAVFGAALARDQARRVSMGQGVRRVLHSPDTPYSYDWNYPLAQHLAGRLWAAQPALWPLFEGHRTLTDLALLPMTGSGRT